MAKKGKTNKSAAKRFKITGTGKLVRRKAGMRHLLEHESSKKKRNKGRDFMVSKSDMAKIKQLLPGL